MRKRLDFLVLNNQKLDTCVANNFKNLKLSFLFLPFLLLLVIALYLFFKDAFSFESYANVQKELFLYLNLLLSKFPNLQLNITELGDVVIFLPFLTVLIVYTPKFWESLLTSLVVSSIFTNLLKRIFAVPRPAAIFDHDSFVILGDTLSGNTSLPSGHSIATFTIITAIYFAFMPQKKTLKAGWFFFVFLIGLIIVSSRVGVGAHYPLDVLIGSIIGYISTIIGVVISKKYNFWAWLTHKKYYPITLCLFSICAFALINKILETNLIVFYFSLVSLLFTTFIITYIYVKKKY